jgi:hypothetical protein
MHRVSNRMQHDFVAARQPVRQDNNAKRRDEDKALTILETTGKRICSSQIHAVEATHGQEFPTIQNCRLQAVYGW